MGITILDAKVLSFEPVNGIDFTELSDLAYDKRTSVLYGISDRGYLYHMDLLIKQNRLSQLTLNHAFKLRSKKGKKFKKSKRDSEGLDLADGGLVISFERKPRVSLFSLKGEEIEEYELSKKLRHIKNYQDKNDALEAVTLHPKYGIVTAPEIPLKKQDEAFHTLYAKKKKWRFKATGSITALETMEDGNILVLERSFNKLTRQRTVVLTKVNIKKCKSKLCSSETLALFDSSKGWTLDNFEGLTRIKGNRYLMISDDNDSFLQKCILVLFEVNE